MKIALATIGSRGDIQPYIALARELNKNGHETFVATHLFAKQLVESYDVKHKPIGQNIHLETEVKKILKKSRGSTKGINSIVRFIIDNLKSCHNELMELFVTVDLIIVTHLFTGLAEAQMLNKPYVTVVLNENAVSRVSQKFMSKQFFRNLLYSLLNSAFLMPYNKFRKEIGAYQLGAKKYDHQKLILFPVSEAIQKKDISWVPFARVTGYFFSDPPDNFIPDKELLDFLEKDKKPLFITVGSMYHNVEKVKNLLDTFIKAAKLAGERAIILIPGLKSGKISEDIIIVNDIPYSWLLQRVSLVIHHCGFGTTSEVLRAGLPSIPLPHISDQYETAKKLYGLGLAHRSLNIYKLTEKKLAKAIINTLSNQEMKTKAEEAGNKIEKENGLQKAVELIHENFAI